MNSTQFITDNIDKHRDYSVDGNEALEIKLIRNPEDLYKDSTSFKPDMCHQVFGDSEHIFGYKGLKVKLYYAADTLDTYVGMEYDEMIDIPGIKPDNVMEMMHSTIQSNYETNLADFEKLTGIEYNFQPFGNKINSYTLSSSEGDRTFEVFFSNTSDRRFMEYHNRVQTFVILYIDAANYVDPEEGKWNFFLMYEKYMSRNMKMKYAFVGYASVYEYYAYPSHIRPRISQIMILPPFRCKGLCSKLLMSIYDYYVKNNNVVDVTVESPSPEFQRVRDFVDCCNCMKLSAFKSEKLLKGYREEMTTEAKQHLKLNKKQTRRIYEILRLKNTNIHNDEDYNAWLSEVKDRIKRPNKKRHQNRKFWAFFGSDPDDLYVPALPASEDADEVEDQIHDDFLQLKEQYDMVNRRLSQYYDE